MKKPIRLFELVYSGSSSVLGGICEILKNKTDTMNDYCWVIMADVNSFGMLEDQCKELKLEEYIIADRKSMVIKNSK